MFHQSMICPTPTIYVRWIAGDSDFTAIHAMDEEMPAERLRELHRQRNVIVQVADVDQDIRGYMIYTLRDRHMELNRLFVARQHRGQGVARAMIAKLVSKLGGKRRAIACTVPDDLVGVHLCLQRCGFLGSLHDAESYRFIRCGNR